MQPEKFIICYFGPKGSGKDTCYDLTNKYIPCNRISFADPLRETLWDLFKDKIKKGKRLWGSISDKEEEITDWEISRNIASMYGYPEKYWTGRRLLQWFGTEVARDLYPEIWINKIHKKLLDSTEVNVVTDCRFSNEYNFLKNLDFKTIFVRIDRKQDSAGFNHSSEQDLNTFSSDITISNNGSIKDLTTELYFNVWKPLLEPLAHAV